jgi:hypothetical protein
VTFFIPRTNVIESDEGYSVEVLGPVGLRYAQDDRVLLVDSEILAGPSGLIVYSASIKLEGSSQAQLHIDAEDRMRIIENIRAAFKFRGFEIEVV